jgi:hypothetical protein
LHVIKLKPESKGHEGQLYLGELCMMNCGIRRGTAGSSCVLKYRDVIVNPSYVIFIFITVK